MPYTKVTNVVKSETWGCATIFGQEESAEIINFDEDVDKSRMELLLSQITIDDPDADAEEANKNKNNPLQYLQSSLFGCVLEDTITQLRILVESNSGLKILKTKYDWNTLLCVKFGVKLPPVADELEGIDPHNLNLETYKINKLDYDRKYITDVVTATYVDLSLNKTFKPLKDHVCAIEATDLYSVVLAEEEARNRIIRKDLTKQLRQQRNHFKSVIYDVNVSIEELNTQVEDAVLQSECQNRYTVSWQRARTEQHVKSIYDKEIVYLDTTEYYKQRTDHEERVHTEIELITNIAISETLQKVEDIMDKYDKDIEAMDLKIQIKKHDYENILEKRKDLERTIEKHEVLMKEWIQFKEEREKARLYREKMVTSAIIVQAWWRGLLVRRQLGPYKPKKKKGGAKKK